MKIAVVSYATKNREWLYSITNPVKQAYCFKHGYDFLFSNWQSFIDRPPAWSKLSHIQNALPNYDWVMWIDDDAMFANHDIGLESIIETYGSSGKDIIIAKDTKYLNTGVVLYRNCEYVSIFMEKWMSDESYRKADVKKGWEQQIFNLEYEQDAEFVGRISVVPMRVMNSFLGGKRSDLKKGLHIYQNGDFIVHASGIVSRSYLDTEERRRFIVDELTKIKDVVRVEYYGAKAMPQSEARLIVSFTSIPRRMENVPAVIESIVKQTKVPDKIVLYLHEDDFPSKSIPNSVSMLTEKYNFFEIRWPERNLGVHLKIIPALKDFPNDLIVNIDDDMIYDEEFIQKLVECHLENPGCVCCNFCHGVKYENDAFRVVKVPQYTGVSNKSVMNRLLSGHGSLYPPHIFDGTCIFDSDAMLAIAKTHDEIWMWGNLFMKGIETVRVGYYKMGEQYKHRFDQSFGLCCTVNTADAEAKMMKDMTEYMRARIDLDAARKTVNADVKSPNLKSIATKGPIATLKGWKPAGYGHF